jgi:hypothetical protein
MAELTTEQQRYLLAAFLAIPQDWFRPLVVGRKLEFSDEQIDSIVQSLAGVGMLTAHPEKCARLTELGRQKATQLRDLEEQPAPRKSKMSLTVMACSAALVAVICVLIWWVRVV